MSKLSRLCVIALVLFGAMAPLTASATPSNTRILRVDECTGTSSSCSASSPVSDGDVVDYFIEIQASAGSSNGTSGFTWLQVQARLAGDDEWKCIRQWSLSGASAPGPRTFVWDTMRWPSSAACDLSGQTNVVQSASSRTANGAYELRARARDAGVGGSLGSPSEPFTVLVSNRASSPSWAAEPRDVGPSKKPAIELLWTGSPEPDMVQYDIERSGPDGQVTYNISATSPGSQGCTRSSSNVFRCYDTNFPSSGYGGTYSYRVVGFRSTPSNGIDCRYGGSCIASQPSAPESASVNEPSPSPSPSNGGSPSTDPSTSPSTGGGSSSPSSSPRGNRNNNRSGGSQVLSGRTDTNDFFSGTYDEQLPYQERGGFGTLLPGDDTGPGGGLPGDSSSGFDEGEDDYLADGPAFTDDEASRRLLVSIAAGLLMVLIAMHIVRLLYER